MNSCTNPTGLVTTLMFCFFSKSEHYFSLAKIWYGSQTNTNFAGENICHGPKISFFLIPIELDFPRNVWICMSAKINAATIEFWYKSYRTCDGINVVRLASQNITSPLQKNDMVVKQTQILQGKTYVMGPKFPIFWHPSS